MELVNKFAVDASPDRVWEFLIDVRRVVPCMPGAEIEEELDPQNWKARMGVALGPLALSYQTDVTKASQDDADRRMVIQAAGRELRGRGNAEADVTLTVAPEDSETIVAIVMDIRVTGRAAQFGRGAITDVTEVLVGEFADNLRRELSASSRAGDEADGSARQVERVEQPRIAGGRLILRALAARTRRFFRRFGRH